MTDEALSSSLASIARDYAAIRQQLCDVAVDHGLLREEVRQLRERLAVLELESTHQTPPPTTLGQAGTAGATWDVNFQSQGKEEPKAHL